MPSFNKYKENETHEIFILDIESKPQESLVSLCEDEIQPSKVLKDPEKIATDIESKKLGLKKKMSVDTDFADIICVGIKQLDQEPKLLDKSNIEQFFNDHPYALYITYNGKSFDLPLLIKWGLKNNLKLPYHDLKEMCKKWGVSKHIDLMELICDKEYKSLDLLLQIYLGIKKTPIDFNTASEEEIKVHCVEDLKNTESLYKLFRVVV